MKIEKFKIISEERGDLCPIEFQHLPFVPQRVFWVRGVPKGESRGHHAHYECQQLLICVQGEIEVRLFNGIYTDVKTLRSGDSILVNTFVWDSQKFLTGDDVLLVLASLPYDKNDYILDRDEFVKMMTDSTGLNFDR